MVSRRHLLAAFMAVLLPANLACAAATGVSEKIELPDEAVTRKVLDNGLIILAKNSPPEGLVSIDIELGAGSSTEAEYLGSGISHFVEHMVFKGTKSRPTGDIEREIKSYGGVINGSAGWDLTSYTVTVPSAYFKQAVALLKDMLLNAVFDAGEFEKERSVLINEMNLYKDDPSRQLIELLNGTAYLRHPYKYPVIGYEEPFRNLKRDDLARYYNRVYVPNRMVIAVVGGIEPAEAVGVIEEEFKQFRPPRYAAPYTIAPEPEQISKRSAAKEMGVNLAYLALGFHSTGVLSRDLFAMDVLSMILGRGDNSRFNKRLLKESALVHNISAWNYTPAEPGLFTITAILDKSNLSAAEAAILDEIRKLIESGVSPEELETAKMMVSSDFLYSLETVEARSADIAKSELLTGSSDFSKRYVEGVQAVSADDVRCAAEKFLRADNLTVATIVPLGYGAEEAAPKTGVQKPAPDSIEKITLANGFRVLLREDRRLPVISITLAMLGGVMEETEKNSGISSLTAEMLMKGTASRKESQIRGAIERLGGGISPFSGFNSFGITVSILKGDAETALELLKDIISNPVFPEEELGKEKILALADLRSEDDDIFQAGSNLFRKALFGASVYSMRPAGEEASVMSIKREDLIRFHRDYCVANNMVLSISGDIDKGAVIKTITELFGKIKAGGQPPAVPAKKTRSSKVEKRFEEMPKDESVILLGFETVSNDDPDRYTIDVLSSVMSGSSGRLFHELRDKLSLAYTLGCAQRQFIGAGYLAFYAATTKDKISAVRNALIEQIKFIKAKPASDDELAVAKRELVAQYASARQSNGFFSYTSALDELYGLGYDNLYKYEENIKKVSSKDIARIAGKYLDLGAYAEVVIVSKDK